MLKSSRPTYRAALAIALTVIITIASSRLRADTGMCGGAAITLPFTDVAAGNIFFCSIAEAYFSALTNGTTPTTFSPSDPVPREQMAAFITRTLDQSLKRGSRRAALDQFWTAQSPGFLPQTFVGPNPRLVKSDGTDIWVASQGAGTVTRVRASDGNPYQTWSGATQAFGVLSAFGVVFVTGQTTPGSLYEIFPSSMPGAVLALSNALGNFPTGIAFDGANIWTANNGGSVSKVTLSPLSVTNITSGFNTPNGILFDGANIWVTDHGASSLLKLDAAGTVIQTVPVGSNPEFPVFDGTNIWVPNLLGGTTTVVRASTGAVLATLSGNGISNPIQAAFDGQRILITNFGGDSVSLWKASDLTPLGSFSVGSGNHPYGVCSDGINFWIAFNATDFLTRF